MVRRMRFACWITKATYTRARIFKICFKSYPCKSLDRPRGLQDVETPRNFQTIGTWRRQGCYPYEPAGFTPRKGSWFSFLLQAESIPDRSAAERMRPNKNLKDPIGKQTRDFLTCSAVPQPTALPRTPRIYCTYCFSTATVVSRTLLNISLYVHCLSFYSCETRHKKFV